MTRCPLLPCADVVVLRADAPITQVGRITLGTERSNRHATIARAGPDCDDLIVGDRVLYRTWIAEVEIENVPWLLVKADDVLARVV